MCLLGKNSGKIIISEDLLTLKNLIGRPRYAKTWDSREEILAQLKELGYRIEIMEMKKKISDKNITPKRRKQIILLLKNKEMSARGVGRALGLSRTRASEYLKFMEEEGILKSRKWGRKKLYSIKEVEK